MTKPDFFHWCALAAGSIAKEDGNFDDSEYVRKLAYAMYESVLKVKSTCKNTKNLLSWGDRI